LRYIFNLYKKFKYYLSYLIIRGFTQCLTQREKTRTFIIRRMRQTPISTDPQLQRKIKNTRRRARPRSRSMKMPSRRRQCLKIHTYRMMPPMRMQNWRQKLKQRPKRRQKPRPGPKSRLKLRLGTKKLKMRKDAKRRPRRERQQRRLQRRKDSSRRLLLKPSA
jgi:hypothetical protein